MKSGNELFTEPAENAFGNMRDNTPLVSVIMGTRYTRDDLFLLTRSVGSILTQTYPNFEFLICDDGSSPIVLNYLDIISQADPRVKLIRKPNCLDLASKLNLCLSAAGGAYIARMDDDDYSHPDRFEKQICFLLQNRGFAFVGCNVALIRNGVKVGERRLPACPTVKDFYFIQPYIHPALMFRREALEAVEGYSEKKSCVLCEDYDLLLQLYTKGDRGANLQECLLDYTVPAGSKGSRTMRHRLNETRTRYERFRALGLLPGALPWVVKPIAVGLLPRPILKKLKERQREGGE